MKSVRLRLIILNYLEFSVLGSYIISLGGFLARNGHAVDIGTFYGAGGLISLVSPVLMGLIADRRISSQKLLGILHLILSFVLISFGIYAKDHIASGNILLSLGFYCLIPLFFLPTLPLTISTSFSVLRHSGMDTETTYPPIRMFGTIGFIAAMVLVDFSGLQYSYGQFCLAGAFAFTEALWTLTIPDCPPGQDRTHTGFFSGLRLLKSRDLVIFFVFTLFMGIMLKISEAYTNPFFTDLGTAHANALISISRISEALCILLLPFLIKKAGIRRIVISAAAVWCLYYAALGAGNTEKGFWLLISAMVFYGMAFDCFNIAGSIYIDQNTDPSVRSTAQSLISMLTNGFGSLIGAFAAQKIVNGLVYESASPDWSAVWYIIASVCLALTVTFGMLFRSGKSTHL